MSDLFSQPPAQKRSLNPLWGVVVCAFFFFMGLSSHASAVHTDATTSGTVISIDVGFSKGGGRHCAVYASYTVEGQQFRTSSESGSRELCALNVGDPVLVNYNFGNPAEARVGDDVHGKMAWLFFALGFTSLAWMLFAAYQGAQSKRP